MIVFPPLRLMVVNGVFPAPATQAKVGAKDFTRAGASRKTGTPLKAALRHSARPVQPAAEPRHDIRALREIGLRRQTCTAPGASISGIPPMKRPPSDVGLLVHRTPRGRVLRGGRVPRLNAPLRRSARPVQPAAEPRHDIRALREIGLRGRCRSGVGQRPALPSWSCIRPRSLDFWDSTIEKSRLRRPFSMVEVGGFEPPSKTCRLAALHRLGPLL